MGDRVRIEPQLAPCACCDEGGSWPLEVSALPPGARFSGKASGNAGPKDRFIRKHAPPIS